jgi:hypothetical protein
MAAERIMNDEWKLLFRERAPARTLLLFFSLVFLSSIPVWIIDQYDDRVIWPGLTISALMIVCPAVTAFGMVSREFGLNGVKAFAIGAFDAHRMKPWAWVFVLLTMPVVAFVSAFCQTISGENLLSVEVDPAKALFLFCIFFVGASFEELGWTGFAASPLIGCIGTICTGMFIGVVTAIWHIVPLIEAERTLGWILWWSVGTVAQRVLILWVFSHGGRSVLCASLFHTMSNMSWALLLMIGLPFDPVLNSSILLIVTAIVLISSAGWLGEGL